MTEPGSAPYGLRTRVQPKLVTTAGGVPAHDPYVRRWWTAVIGSAAVTDLLRLHVAATRSVEIAHPTHLHVLVETGLVRVLGRAVAVPTLIPRLGAVEIARLAPSLRREHTIETVRRRRQRRTPTST